MTTLIFDVESTDLEPDAQIIEAAWLKLPEKPSPDMVVDPEESLYCERFEPSKKISFGAMAVHHITPEELKGCRPSSAFRLPIDVTYLVGHNIDHDWKCARSPEDVKRICTLAMARRVYPDLDSYTQSALMYMAFGSGIKENLRNAHSALADVTNNLLLLRHILQLCLCLSSAGAFDTWEKVWKFSEECRIPKTMPFGKHQGVLLEDLPADYVGWLFRQEWFATDHPYLKLALERL